MDSIISYQILYTEAAVRDIEEKFDYIARLRGPGLHKHGTFGFEQRSRMH